MTARNERYWGTIQPLAAPMLAMQAKMQEDAGLEGRLRPAVRSTCGGGRRYDAREAGVRHRPGVRA
jgi:hypothetical protein